MNGCVGVFVFLFFFEQYLRPKPLLTKSYYLELIKTNRHNNADLKWVNHIRLAEITAECSVLHIG